MKKSNHDCQLSEEMKTLANRFLPECQKTKRIIDDILTNR